MSEISLQKQLQKTFQVLETVVGLWEKTLADCACTVAATTNLCEQYFDCKGLAVVTLPVGKILPDVQERLLYKILSELDRKVADLRDKLSAVKVAQDKFSKHQEQCVKLYKRHSNELDVYKMTESTAIWPSMSTMLEVLVDSDCLLFDLYNLKMHWIEQLSEEKTINCETLTHSWSSGDKDILQNLKDSLCHLTFFVQERV
ncbi:AFG2-interacting ribosome maturation factor-like [Haliotis cracherodii]|uniref:AFG2-interacting ribosome maturation factor-like n=1 Tax=Haliotis cracherodii TaxID=6455 RepID=UPI0039ED6636